MHKLNLILVAALFAGAGVLGTVAAMRTTALSTAHTRTTDRAVVQRAHQLDRFAASLRAQLRKHPPALPPLPKPAAAPTQVQAAPVAPRVVYQRPAPIVIVHHTHHGDDGGQREAEGGGGGD